MGAPAEVETTLLRRSYLVRNIGAVTGVVGAALAFTHSGDRRFALILGFGIVASMLIVLGAKGVLQRIPAHVTSRGIRVRERIVAARNTIRGAWIEPTSDAAIVHVGRGPHADVQLETPDEVGAQAVCRELFGGSTYGMPRFTAWVRWPWIAMIVWGQLFAHALLRREPSPRSVLELLALSLAFVLPLYLRRRLSVGTDGVLMSGALRSRFVPFRDLGSAAALDQRSPSLCKLVITRRDDGPIVLWMRRAEAEAAAARIQAAIDASDGSAETARLQLRRDGPDVREWLARLRALTRRREPYRAVGATADALWRLLDDPGAGESERAAAAVVLGTDASGEERTRLREVAARVASPRVRVAMERVAAGAEEDDLAAAMDAVEDSGA